MLLSFSWEEGLKILLRLLLQSMLMLLFKQFEIRSVCSSGVKDPGDIALTFPSTYHSVFLAKLLDLGRKKLGWFWRIIFSDTVTFKETQFSYSMVCTGYISRMPSNLSCGLRKKMFAFIFLSEWKIAVSLDFVPCVCYSWSKAANSSKQEQSEKHLGRWECINSLFLL